MSAPAGPPYDFGPRPLTPNRILAARLDVAISEQLGEQPHPWVKALADQPLPDPDPGRGDASVPVRNAIEVISMFDPDDCGHDGPVTRTEFDTARNTLQAWLSQH